jgi:Ca-activated chloride channel family protein
VAPERAVNGGFLWPAALLLLLPWGAAAWVLGRREAAARERAIAALGERAVLARAGVLPPPAAGRRRAVLRGLAVALAVVALARPWLGTEEVSGARAGRDVMVAIDLSRSMRVGDARGTRLERAKAIVGDVASGLPGDRFGLVIFGGAAFLQLPLTTDRASFERFLAAASHEAIDDPGTDILAAVEVAAAAFEQDAAEGHRALLLLSDGERSEGNLDEAIATARDAGLPVFAIGIGTAQGAYVPADTLLPADSGSTYHLDNIGRPVISRLREDDLARLATETGGAYARWDDAAAVRGIVAGIGRITARQLGVETQEEPSERFQWPLGLAVLLLALDLLPFGRPARRLARAAVPAVLLLGTSCLADWPALSRAGRDYEAGRFEEALTRWRAVLARHDTPALRYNAGNAEYRMQRYEEAIESYRKALAAPDSSLRRRALLNLGNAYVRAAEDRKGQGDFLDRAIGTYEELLALDPADSSAKWNLEIALRKRSDVETGGSPGRGGRAQAGQGNGGEEGLDSDRETAIGAMAGGGQGDAGGESAEELSEQDARRLLEAIEREQLGSHEGRPASGGQRADRDW